MDGLADRTSIAPSSYPGAITTSVKIDESAVAISSEILRFAATTPPKADTGSQACAAR